MREQLLALYGAWSPRDTRRAAADGGHQRADATVVGGFERGQLGLRISFRLDDPEAW
ncbi:hypothetical protein [Pseudonocardia sp. Ae717_Ps2]|uniref:hypothetical protein n=1 Tax=Pseudonocardia sp. Ae717_Ps2 TaxID=1885573 RepID=UPI0013014474|nr:hypothetical protein [Pseudonocardia sp. Ae717_Ps2]